jgi:hypothetical protein
VVYEVLEAGEDAVVRPEGDSLTFVEPTAAVGAVLNVEAHRHRKVTWPLRLSTYLLRNK